MLKERTQAGNEEPVMKSVQLRERLSLLEYLAGDIFVLTVASSLEWQVEQKSLAEGTAHDTEQRTECFLSMQKHSLPVLLQECMPPRRPFAMSTHARLAACARSSRAAHPACYHTHSSPSILFLLSPALLLLC